MVRQRAVADIDANRLNELIREGRAVLVELWASWWGPCKPMIPVLDTLAAELADRVDIVRLQIFDPVTPVNDDWAKLFDVRSVPSFILFDQGEDVAGLLGLMGLTPMRDWIADHVATARA